MNALVLEPDPTVCAWLEAGLRSRGHTAVSRSAADEAWGAYEQQQPTLALLDWAGQDGALLCRRIRAQASGDRCVVLAMGLSDRLAELEGALDLGADDYFPKMADAAVLEGRLAVAERRVQQIEARTSAEEALMQSERRYRDIVESARDVIATVAPEGKILSLNPAFETLTGWRPAKWIGRGFERLVHPEDAQLVHDMLRRVQRGEAPQPREIRVRSRSGGWRIVEYTATAQALDGQAAKVLAIARDVTERKREQRCEATRRVATRVLGDAASLTEAAGRLLQALCVGLGWEVGLLWAVDRDERRLRFVSLWHLPTVDVAALLAASRADRPGPGEGRMGEAWHSAAALWTVDDPSHGLRASLAVPIKCGAEIISVLQLLSPDPRPVDPVALRTTEEIGAEIGNLLARLQAEEALRESEQRRALTVRSARGGPAHDPLTGLPNRAAFAERLRREIVRARQQKDSLFAVLFIDLDRFKRVNDRLGHLAGDQALIAVARRLEACVRPGDVVSRFGGDEFALLLARINEVGDASQVAQRIQRRLAVPLDHEPFTTASIGIALSATGYERPNEILRDADRAMYRAKAAGRARQEVFDEVIRERAVIPLRLENEAM